MTPGRGEHEKSDIEMRCFESSNQLTLVVSEKQETKSGGSGDGVDELGSGVRAKVHGYSSIVGLCVGRETGGELQSGLFSSRRRRSSRRLLVHDGGSHDVRRLMKWLSGEKEKCRSGGGRGGGWSGERRRGEEERERKSFAEEDEEEEKGD